MRILFLSNFYPPAHLGGKEIRCQEVVQGLGMRGHACLVLTSDFAPKGVTLPDQAEVCRVLALEADVHKYHPLQHLLRYPARLRANLCILDATISTFEPDLVFIWGMWNLSPALAALAEERLPGRVVYSFGGYWPLEPDVHEQYWKARDDHWLGRQFRRALASLALSSRYRPVHACSLTFPHAITCSQSVLDQLQEGGLILPHGKVMFSGIDVNYFVPIQEPGSCAPGQLNVLYAGGLSPRKGIHVLIQAMRLLVRQGHQHIHVTIVGEGHSEYRIELERMVNDAALSESVHFQPAVPRCDMPRLLQQFDALVLPSGSEVPEPLSRVVMEAMACGLVVVGTGAGGTPEMIEHGVDGLLFAPGDSAALADHIRSVAADPHLRQRLSTMARHTAEARFQIGRMVDEIEAFLEGVLAES
jgi:glycosyltransferase involved in cell wall biosynthesis